MGYSTKSSKYSAKSNKYKAKSSKYKTNSNKYKTNSNKYTTNSNKYKTYSNKYKVNCSKKVSKSIYNQSVTTQKCGTFIEYIIKRHIVAINDTKVWHIPSL